jgi:hypothetical protein
LTASTQHQQCTEHPRRRRPSSSCAPGSPVARVAWPGMRFLMVALAPAGVVAVACETTKTGKKCAT